MYSVSINSISVYALVSVLQYKHATPIDRSNLRIIIDTNFTQLCRSLIDVYNIKFTSVRACKKNNVCDA